MLLGCVGVASAVNVFVKEKLPSVAVLRCLGVSAWAAMKIYLFQILIMGLVGSLVGAFLGSIVAICVTCAVFEDFLPVKVNVDVSWSSVGFGVLTGLFVSVHVRPFATS
jgi:putative ABC transport system permease protein